MSANETSSDPTAMAGKGTDVERPTPKRPESKRPEPRRPYHVGVAVGLTTSVYAATLLLTTQLQIDADRAVIADRDPVQAAIAALGDHHESMTDMLDRSRDQYNAALGNYDSVLASLDRLDERLAVVDGSVRAAERLGASISSSLSLPPLPGRASSGGSASSKGSSGGEKPVKPPRAAPPPAPPPTSASTGASGAP